MREIEFWDSCSVRALARRDRRALQGALHGDVAVAAVGEVLGAAGRVAREGEGQREAQEGKEVVRDAWAPAHDGVMAGKAEKASAAALSVASAASSRAERGRRG